MVLGEDLDQEAGQRDVDVLVRVPLVLDVDPERVAVGQHFDRRVVLLDDAGLSVLALVGGVEDLARRDVAVAPRPADVAAERLVDVGDPRQLGEQGRQGR